MPICEKCRVKFGVPGLSVERALALEIGQRVWIVRVDSVLLGTVQSVAKRDDCDLAFVHYLRDGARKGDVVVNLSVRTCEECALMAAEDIADSAQHFALRWRRDFESKLSEVTP